MEKVKGFTEWEKDALTSLRGERRGPILAKKGRRARGNFNHHTRRTVWEKGKKTRKVGQRKGKGKCASKRKKKDRGITAGGRTEYRRGR